MRGFQSYARPAQHAGHAGTARALAGPLSPLCVPAVRLEEALWLLHAVQKRVVKLVAASPSGKRDGEAASQKVRKARTHCILGELFGVDRQANLHQGADARTAAPTGGRERLTTNNGAPNMFERERRGASSAHRKGNFTARWARHTCETTPPQSCKMRALETEKRGRLPSQPSVQSNPHHRPATFRPRSPSAGRRRAPPARAS